MDKTLPVLMALALCILATGCVLNPTQPAASTAPAPVMTPPVTPPPLEPVTCSLVPGPTQQVPDYEEVSVTVDRNTITADPTISVIFNGGLGLGMVQNMNVTVVRSDCVTEHEDRKNPLMGETVTLMGTLSVDRVVVVMTMTSGDQYTIIDADYPFGTQMA